MRHDALNPLTFEEHREFGREIQKAKVRLQHFAGMVAGIYGPQSRSTFAFRKLMEAMERTAVEMQAQAEQDCPGLHAGDFYR
jgi:hypothetical protein